MTSVCFVVHITHHAPPLYSPLKVTQALLYSQFLDILSLLFFRAHHLGVEGYHHYWAAFGDGRNTLGEGMPPFIFISKLSLVSSGGAFCELDPSQKKKGYMDFTRFEARPRCTLVLWDVLFSIRGSLPLPGRLFSPERSTRYGSKTTIQWRGKIMALDMSRSRAMTLTLEARLAPSCSARSPWPPCPLFFLLLCFLFGTRSAFPA